MTEIDAEIDALYADAPETFTKRRNDLAKRLAAEGKADLSANVKSLRKPTQIAWVLNQVARRYADDVAELVDVGRELARAQRKTLRGGDTSGDLRAAIGRQRDVVRSLTRKTASLMGELGVTASGHLDEVAGALQAALVDPTVGAELEEGRLEKVPAPAAGFPGAAPQAEARPEKKETAKQRAARERRERKERRAAELAARRDEERAAAREAKKKEHDARAAALDAKRREALARARTEADEARARADLLSGQAEEARRSATELRADANRLREEAKELAREARERAKEAKTAERSATRAETKARHLEKTAKDADHAAARLVTKARRE